MERRENVVIGLEQEFRKALQGVVTLTEFTQEIGKLLGLMGFSDFSFFNWTAAGHYDRTWPKKLIKKTSEQTVNQAVNYFVDTVSGQPNTALLNIYYKETGSPVDPPESSIRRGCYRLVTSTGNYAYFTRKGSQTTNFQQVLSVVNKNDDSDQFRVHIEKNQLALDTINRVVEEIGVDRFPVLFSTSKSKDKVNIGSKPLRLLNIIAREGITLSQAADVLDITVDTANKHIAKIKSELGVTTLPSAVFHAANKGLIDRVL